MTMIPDEIIEQVRDAADLVTIVGESEVRSIDQCRGSFFLR